MSDDLIKRSDAIKALEREKSDWNNDYNVPIDNCIKRLNKVKSANRPQEWIPCSERLPERLERVLVTRANGRVEETFRWDNEEYPWNGGYDDILAWMPLPEPYTADTPQTESENSQIDCRTCRHNKSGWYEKGSLSCERCCGVNFEFYEPKGEPQERDE